MIPDPAHDWREAWEAQCALTATWKARYEHLLEETRAAPPPTAVQTVSLGAAVEVAILDHSFGNRHLEGQTRSIALALKKNGVPDEEIVHRIETGVSL